MKKTLLLLALLCAMPLAYATGNLRQAKCHIETRRAGVMPEIKMNRTVNPRLAAGDGLTLDESFESADKTFPEGWTLS